MSVKGTYSACALNEDLGLVFAIKGEICTRDMRVTRRDRGRRERETETEAERYG